MTCTSRLKCLAVLPLLLFGLSAFSSLPPPAKPSASYPPGPPQWLDQLGTHLRADKDHWVHRWEASQPSPERPIRCGLSLAPRTLPKTICAADPNHHPGCVDGITLLYTCHNL